MTEKNEANPYIQEERDRIKALFERKLKALIEKRDTKKSKKSKRSIPISEAHKLRDDFFFLIDNPEYKRKKPKSN